MLSFIIALAAALNGCECVPDIITPKEITPANSADVLYINALLDVDDITCYGNDFSMGYYNYQDSLGEYVQAEAGLNYMRVKNPGDVSLLFAPCDYTLGAFYTTCVYGYGSAARTIVYRDSIENLSVDSSYIRLINLSFTYSDIKFVLYYGNKKIIDRPLPFLAQSGFKATPNDSVKLEIYRNSDGSLISSVDNIFVKAGLITDIILNEPKKISNEPSYRFIYCNRPVK